MQWELIEVTEDVPCTMDDSGIYVIVNRYVRTITHKQYSGERIRIRIDVMTEGNEPIRSFIGDNPNAVRKAVIHFLNSNEYAWNHRSISSEHASYIGYDIHRAFTDPQFVQD